MTEITKEDVTNLASTQWTQLDDAVFDRWLEIAEGMMEHQFSQRVSTLPNFEGDRKNGLSLLTAHFLELAEGGEAQSESSEGGSVTYNTVTGNPVESLQETRYGRLFRDQDLFDEQVSVVRPK